MESSFIPLLSKELNNILQHVGFPKSFDPKVEIYNDYKSPDRIIGLALVNKTPIDYLDIQNNPNKVISNYVECIVKDFRESQLVKNLVENQTSKIEQELEKLTGELEAAEMSIKMLNNEIQKLNPYKNHYDLEFKLKNGEQK